MRLSKQKDRHDKNTSGGDSKSLSSTSSSTCSLSQENMRTLNSTAAREHSIIDGSYGMVMLLVRRTDVSSAQAIARFGDSSIFERCQKMEFRKALWTTTRHSVRTYSQYTVHATQFGYRDERYFYTAIKNDEALIPVLFFASIITFRTELNACFVACFEAFTKYCRHHRLENINQQDD